MSYSIKIWEKRFLFIDYYIKIFFYIADIHCVYCKYKAMKILEFIQKYPDENACRQKFKEQRNLIGVI